MANIKDVAAKAGVSLSTVHYALNGKRPISDAVRQRIMQAVNELEYTASSLGQRMQAGRSYSIGLIAPQLPSSDASVLEMLISTATTASHAKHTLGFFLGQTPEQVLQQLKDKSVDGLILAETTHIDPRIEVLKQTKFPFVLIGRTQNLEGLSIVDFDFEAATFAAIETLVQLGHSTIGFIASHANADLNVENWFYVERGIERVQKTYDVKIVRQSSRITPEDGYRATQMLLQTEPEITAIFSASGVVCVGALRALYTQRIHVPDDFSVISITTAQVAEWTIPKLSSVDMPLFEMGCLATKLLLQKLAGETVNEQVLMPAKVVIRESTAPPKKKTKKRVSQRARASKAK